MLKTPPLQTATATIDTLCGRLQSATLLEDRRGAIMGLRSFAKQFPASVAGGSLRELIATLRRDGLGEAGSKSEGGGDIDTIRLVLETLLMLFNPESSSPEASDEIAFFMADEFSMRQDNIALLLSLLDPTSPYADYYSRLYSVQLLSAICAARPDRLQECILSAPLGVSRLVSVLDDSREAVRGAGLLLLVDLTTGADEALRKIVAFEDVFGKTFALIQAEGGLAEAGILTQDCLSLLANLIKGSASNQTMFRESGCVLEMTQLLKQAFPTSGEAAFIASKREKATWGLLKLLDLFLEPGDSSTLQNQGSFFRVGIAQVLIDLGFYQDLRSSIRGFALSCAGAMIKSNAPLQEAFAGLTVVTAGDPVIEPKAVPHLNGTRSGAPSARASARPSVELPLTYIIEALLELALSKAEEDVALRSAACGLIQAYLADHDKIKAHFMQRALAGHAERESMANVLTTLLQQPGNDYPAVTFASWIVSDLIDDNPDAKAALIQTEEGNKTEGEETLTAIQTMGVNLQSALQVSNETLVSAYASLLTIFAWDCAGGVNDLLSEGSSLVQALVLAAHPSGPSPVIAGLSTTLLGTIYEFSTKDSPIPRRTLTSLLTQRLTRNQYLEALAELRRHPAIRDADVDEPARSETVLCKTFVDLFTVEYSRLRKAIDKDPGIEVLPSSAAEAGIDRDVLDDLRQQVQAMKDALLQNQQEASAAGQQHDQDRMTAAKELQTANAEVERLRRINQAMQQGHESELESIAVQQERARHEADAAHQEAIAAARQDAEQQVRAALQEREAASTQKGQEYERRIAELGNAHRVEQSEHAATRDQLESLTMQHADVSARERNLGRQIDELTNVHQKLTHEHQQLRGTASQGSDELERLRTLCDEQQQKVDILTARIEDSLDDLQGKEDELAAERAGFAELEKELEAVKSTSGASRDHAQALTKAEKQLEEARAGEKSAREELESMLLVMSDIEAKRDEYKVKIKAMGGEVTEEEDEEEDDDGESVE